VSKKSKKTDKKGNSSNLHISADDILEYLKKHNPDIYEGIIREAKKKQKSVKKKASSSKHKPVVKKVPIKKVSFKTGKKKKARRKLDPDLIRLPHHRYKIKSTGEEISYWEYLKRYRPETFKKMVLWKKEHRKTKSTKSEKVEKVSKSPQSSEERMAVRFVKVKPIKRNIKKRISKKELSNKEINHYKKQYKRPKKLFVPKGWERVQHGRYRNVETGEELSYRKFMKRFRPRSYKKLRKWDRVRSKYEKWYDDHPTLKDFSNCVYKKDILSAIQHFIEDVDSDAEHPDISVLNIIKGRLEKGSIFLKSRCLDFDEHFEELLERYDYV